MIGTSDRRILKIKHRLTKAYRHNGEWGKAAKLQESVVASYAIMLPVNDLGRLNAQFMLARYYYKCSLYDKALTLAKSIAQITPTPPDPCFAEDTWDLILRILHAKHEAAANSAQAKDESENVYETAGDTLECDYEPQSPVSETAATRDDKPLKRRKISL